MTLLFLEIKKIPDHLLILIGPGSEMFLKVSSSKAFYRTSNVHIVRVNVHIAVRPNRIVSFVKYAVKVN